MMIRAARINARTEAADARPNSLERRAITETSAAVIPRSTRAVPRAAESVIRKRGGAGTRAPGDAEMGKRGLPGRELSGADRLSRMAECDAESHQEVTLDFPFPFLRAQLPSD